MATDALGPSELVYGYYLALADTEHGDPWMAGLGRRLWALLGHKSPSKFDGVSCWKRGESVTIRTVARDLFRNETRQYRPCPPFEVPHIHVADAKEGGAP